MQIVINIDDIPKNDHERWAMSHGIILPKGHGRLKDIDKLKSDGDIVTNYNYCSAVSWKQIIDAPTVLEADKEI